MVSSRIINNDDEYIDGLLDSSPAIVDVIYKRYSRKVKHMVIGWGGNIKEAANVFEETILAIYNYARHHKLFLTNRFEPFFLYACQLKWKQELMQKTPGKGVAFHPEAPEPGLDDQHLKYVEEAIAWSGNIQDTDNTREELEEMLADQRERWFHTKGNPNTRISIYVVITAIIAAGLAGLLFLSPWHKDVYRQFSGTEMEHIHHEGQEGDTSLLLHEAASSFNHGHYTHAIQVLDQVLAKDSLHAAAHYFKGVSLIELGKQKDARKELVTVFSGTSAFQYNAAFYIALSYLKEGKKQQCLEWLLKIPDNAPVYFKAQSLKDELAERN
jgi:tetratricopeptide (TPR) repeat protein